MAVLDTDILTQLQYHVVEPEIDGGVTWALGDWTAATVINYLNQRQNRFLQETGIRVTRDTTIITTPNVHRYELPDDLLRINRLSWRALDGGSTVELPRSDTWVFDNGYPDWQYETAARPSLYTEYEVPQRIVQLMPASWDGGVLHLLYVAAGTALNNAGIALSVPDECAPFILWGTLSDMLRETARVQDKSRAEYCEARYQLGVESTLILLNSWTSY